MQTVDPVGMFDIGEEQTLSPIPRSPQNKSLHESCYSVASEQRATRQGSINIPCLKACKLISYIFARENNEPLQNLSPDSPKNAKDAYQIVASPSIQIQEVDQHTPQVVAKGQVTEFEVLKVAEVPILELGPSEVGAVETFTQVEKAPQISISQLNQVDITATTN